MPPSDLIDQTAFNTMLENIGGDTDFLGELLNEYLISSEELFAQIRQSIAAKDAPTLQRAAHTLKGGSASFGANAFAAQCRELEFIGRSGVLDEAEGKAKALESAYPDVVAALQALVESTRAA